MASLHLLERGTFFCGQLKKIPFEKNGKSTYVAIHLGSEKTAAMKLPSPRDATFYIIFIFIVFFFSVLIVDPIGGFPIGDDWQYAYPVKTWIEKGVMEFKGIFAPNVLLQVAWGYLFCKISGGFDFTWLRLSTLILGFLGVVYFFKILKRTAGSYKATCFTTLSLLFSPLFFYLSFTFFTDVPFLALFIFSIYSFMKYLDFGKTKFLALAIFWSAASFYIRQPGLLLIAAFGIYFIIEKRFSKKSLLLCSSFFLIAGAIYFSLEKWIKPALSIADNFVPVGGQFYTALIETPLFTGFEWVKKGIKTFIYLGFFGLPFVPFFYNKIIKEKLINEKIGGSLLLLNTALFLALYFMGKTFPFGGNILFNFGLGSELLADVYTLGLPNTPKLPEWAMLVVQFISQLSATFLFFFILKKYKTLSLLQKKLTLFLVIFNLVYLPVMSITSFFDRYLLPTIVSFFIVLSFFIEIKTNRKAAWKFVPLILIGGFSILATKDFMAWNRAKNKAFLFLQEQGVSIKEMDAGYEYNGFYNYHFPREEKEGRSFWWVTDDRYLITFGSVGGYRQIASFPYDRCLFLQQSTILVLRRDK